MFACGWQLAIACSLPSIQVHRAHVWELSNINAHTVLLENIPLPREEAVVTSYDVQVSLQLWPEVFSLATIGEHTAAESVQTLLQLPVAAIFKENKKKKNAREW